MRRPKRRIIKKGHCPFCKEKSNPDFRQYEALRAFISERGKIQGRARTGVCSKHQKRLTIGIKRARHLAFLPFVVRA